MGRFQATVSIIMNVTALCRELEVLTRIFINSGSTHYTETTFITVLKWFLTVTVVVQVGAILPRAPPTAGTYVLNIVS